jgi:hypothetical protein
MPGDCEKSQTCVSKAPFLIEPRLAQLKDVAESRRAGTVVAEMQHRERGTAAHIGGFEALVMSAQFWPGLDSDEATASPTIHESLTRQAEDFAAKYAQARAGMKFVPMYGLGYVELEVDIPGKPAPLAVIASPLEATVLMRSMERGASSVSELVEMCGAEEEAIRGCLAKWVRAGALRVSEDGAVSAAGE